MTMVIDWSVWEPRFRAFLTRDSAASDAAHDLTHIARVLKTARQLAYAEQAALEIVLPAAWLHDCVTVPKNSPDRSRASTIAAQAARMFLEKAGYPQPYLPAIEHAIAAHSFSAGIAPQTVEARVLQDADRLDALGAIGIARCFSVGGALARPLYDADQPWPTTRPPDDSANSVDHFFVKLLRLEQTMQTDAGQAEARRRTEFLRAFLRQLGSEIGAEGLMALGIAG